MHKCQACSNVPHAQDHFHVVPAYARCGVRYCTQIQVCLVFTYTLHVCCVCVCVCVCVLVSKQHASVCVSVHLPKGVGFVAKSRCLVRGHWVARLCVIGSLE